MKTGNNHTPQPDRFCISLVGRDGKIHAQQQTNDAQIAVQKLFAYRLSNFGDQHGPGAYASLFDQQLELCSSFTAEGKGCYRVHARTPAAEQLLANHY
jgi:hypothetical protein